MKSGVKIKIFDIEQSDLNKHLLTLGEVRLLLNLSLTDFQEILENSPAMKIGLGTEKHLGFKVDVEAYSQIRQCACRNKTTLSSLLRRFVREGLERETLKT